MLSNLWKSSNWQDPDWRVREHAAYRLKDPARLLQLALNDVAEEVRVAATKSLVVDSDRLTVIREGTCDRARRLALTMLEGRAAVRSCVRDRTLPSELRFRAAEQFVPTEDDLLELAVREEPEAMRLFAITRLAPGPRLDQLYGSDLSLTLKLALVPKLTDQRLLRGIFEKEKAGDVRRSAIGRLRDATILAELFLREDDAELRRLLAAQIRDETVLVQLLTDERDPQVRLAMAASLTTESHLAWLAHQDSDARVRQAAVERLVDAQTLVDVSLADVEERVRLAALQRLREDPPRLEIIRRSEDDRLRWSAVQQIASRESLLDLAGGAARADVRWLAGRRVGQLPLADLVHINSPWALRQIALHDELEFARKIAAWCMRERPDLNELAACDHAIIREIAAFRLREVTGPAGIRFIPIRGRPYMLSAFPVTRGQIRAVLGPHARWAGDDELPATGITPQEAVRLCAKLSQADDVAYRLPTLEEWRHAATADDPTWFREFPVAEELGEAVGRLAVPVARTGPRPMTEAWPNPWGLLDMLGNVCTWVEDEIGDEAWVKYLQPRERLSAVDNGVPLLREQFALASGFCWSDLAVRLDRYDRLVRLGNDNEAARGRLGVRLLREGGGAPPLNPIYKLTLQSEGRWGLSRKQVTENIAPSGLFSRDQMESYWRVAPVVVSTSRDYDALRRKKRRLDLAGAHAIISAEGGV